MILPIAAFLLSVILHLGAVAFFPRWKLLDFPERYKLKRKPIPYPTGMIAVAIFLLFFLAIEEHSGRNLGLAGCITLLAFVSFLDDRRGVSAWKRLLVQVLIGIVVYVTGTRIFSLTNPLEALTGIERIQLDTWIIPSEMFANPSVWGILFTVLWLGLTINALNWFDGISGQVSTLSTIGFLTIGFLSLSERVSQPDLALLAFLLAGIAAAGLLFDFPPGKVLMGDTGAMFFGLMLGVLTIYSGGKVATAFLVLGVPLIDSGLVIVRRVASGRHPFQGSLSGEHLHHRLLAKGWNERQIISVTALLGGGFGIAALFLSTIEKFVAACFFALIMLILSHYTAQ